MTGPTPFLYRYRVTSDGPGTLVELDAAVQLPWVTALVPQLAKRAMRSGVDANLAEVKTILESQQAPDSG